MRKSVRRQRDLRISGWSQLERWLEAVGGRPSLKVHMHPPCAVASTKHEASIHHLGMRYWAASFSTVSSKSSWVASLRSAAFPGEGGGA